MSSRSQRIAAFFLLLILGANFLHSIFWHDLRLSPPWHDHIILGLVDPGWEYHHRGELTNAQESYHSQGKLTLLSKRLSEKSWSRLSSLLEQPGKATPQSTFQTGSKSEQTISAAVKAIGRSKIISLYRLPMGDGPILSFEVQSLWLAEWPILAIFSPLAWPLDLAVLRLSSAFLPPFDKPPTII
jgi:hypothetical protein